MNAHVPEKTGPVDLRQIEVARASRPASVTMHPQVLASAEKSRAKPPPLRNVAAAITPPTRYALHGFFVRSLRGRLVLLVAAVLLPGILLTTWLIVQTYASARTAVERNLRESVRALSLLTDALLRQHEAQLEGVAATLDPGPGNMASLDRKLRSLSRERECWFVLADTTGRQWINTSQPPGASLPTIIPPPDLLEAVRRGRTHISNLAASSVSARPVVRITVPVRGDAGQGWMLSCVISSDAVAASLLNQQIGVGWLISVIDREGRIVARSRDPERYVGGQASSGMFERTRENESGIVETVTLDGIKSHTAFHRSPLSGWTVILAAPRADLLRNPTTLAAVAGAVSLLFGLTTTLLALWVGRAVVLAVRGLVEQTHELGQGPVPMRPTGMIETDIVAQALVESSRKLASRESDLSRARDEALAASRAKDEFLATLSHELRTPLNPVLLLASDAASDPAIPMEVRELFRAVEKNVRLEARLIDDLLDLTRIGRGKLSLNREVVDLGAILRDAVATVADFAREKRIELAGAPACEGAQVDADPVRLQQVFWNLLSNAIKFTPEGGRVTVRTRTTDAAIDILVSDTGLGLTPGELKRIFEPFVQGDHTAQNGSRRFGGLGLGLAICRMLVEKHGGRIGASSAGRGQGATFTVTLPLHCAGETAALTRTGGDASRA